MIDNTYETSFMKEAKSARKSFKNPPTISSKFKKNEFPPYTEVQIQSAQNTNLFWMINNSDWEANYT
ncbi:16714_t:CDS:2, partial [Gigaspora rosea]